VARMNVRRGRKNIVVVRDHFTDEVSRH
jgi:hypothetical protein